MDAATRVLVRERARFRCEYCLFPERYAGQTFHVEHIIPCFHGGSDAGDNLAFACPDCNQRKGTNLTGLDPDTGQAARLFDPRRDSWSDHFRARQGRIMGLADVGRTTVWVLDLNQADRVGMRRLLTLGGIM